MPYIILAILIILCIGVHLTLDKTARAWPRVAEVCLLYLLVIGVGIAGLLAFCAHAFFANQTARQIGWPTGSPFQFEIAMANLAFGVLGILCVWLRGAFWYATGIGYSIFLLGAAYGHIVQITVNHNYAPDNAGAILYYDIVLPIVVLVLLLAYALLKQPRSAAPTNSTPLYA